MTKIQPANPAAAAAAAATAAVAAVVVAHQIVLTKCASSYIGSVLLLAIVNELEQTNLPHVLYNKLFYTYTIHKT